MGNVSYRPLIENMTWSYSRIKCFESCPYQWFCKYICGDSEQPMFYASYGSYIHRLIERYYRGELSAEELSTEYLLGYSTNVLGERPPEATARKYFDAGQNYFENFRPFPFTPVSVEEELRFSLNGIDFLAFSDFIGEQNGKLAVIDHKSRDLKPRSLFRGKETAKDRELDEMLRQLYLYAYGVKQKYGEFPRLLCFNCFKNGEFITEPFREAEYVKALDWAKQMTEEIAAEEEFRPNIEYFQCRYLCGLHDECVYYDGGDAS